MYVILEITTTQKAKKMLLEGTEVVIHGEPGVSTIEEVKVIEFKDETWVKFYIDKQWMRKEQFTTVSHSNTSNSDIRMVSERDFRINFMAKEVEVWVGDKLISRGIDREYVITKAFHRLSTFNLQIMTGQVTVNWN